jgi:hypothetical protein
VNRKIWLLNLALVALAGTLVWQLRAHWRTTVSHEREVLAKTPEPKPVIPPPPPPAVKAATPGEYIDVAQKTLFARDRNPNPIEDPPPPPPPPPPVKPVPPMPVYRGQMAIGGPPVVILSVQGAEQKSYHEGEDVGPFKLIAFDREKVTLEFDGKKIEKKVSELQPKEAPPPPPAQNAGAAPAQAKSLSGPAKQETPSFGNDMGGGFRGCAAGDTSPAGTVLQGFKKVVATTAMGQSCHWEQIK